MANPKRGYGAIPMRAFPDHRLHRTHLAVLGAIAYFDGFGRNGCGCYASQQQIADIAGCNRWTVCRRQRELIDWGYLRATKSSKRGRTQYHVLYEESAESCAPVQHFAAESCATGQPTDAESCATEQHQMQDVAPQDTQRDIPEHNSDEVAQPNPSISGESSTPSDDSRLHDGHRLNGDSPSKARDPAEAAADEAPAVLCERDPDESAPCTRVPDAPDHSLEVCDLPEGDLWAYRARVARYLRRGGVPTDDLHSDVGRIFEGVLEAYDDDRGMQCAFEELLMNVEVKLGMHADV